jgi:hypothetical protein
MKFPRYKQLSPLNKLFYWAAIATFISFVLTVVSFLMPSGSERVSSFQTIGPNSPQYVAGDNSTFNITEEFDVSKGRAIESMWKKPGAWIVVAAIVVLFLALVVTALWRGSRSITAKTAGDNSPQYIAGNNSTFNITQTIEDIQTTLSRKYPFGWVLFNHPRNGTYVPFTSGELQCDADWTETKLELNTQQRAYSLILPELRWLREGPRFLNLHERRHRPYTGTYEIGRPTLLPTMLWAEGEPLAHLEILDDTLRLPVFVIGFKKQPPGAGPPKRPAAE